MSACAMASFSLCLQAAICMALIVLYKVRRIENVVLFGGKNYPMLQLSVFPSRVVRLVVELYRWSLFWLHPF